MDNQNNPQLENGYLRIANEIVNKLCQYRLSGEEWQVLWVILRKTYGYNKKEDKISLSVFVKLTGLKRQNVFRAIKKLSSKKIIGVIKNDDSKINSYCFNKNFYEWKSVIKNDDSKKVSSKLITGVIKNDDNVSSKLIPTKDNIKDNIQKTYIDPKNSLEYLINEEALKSDYMNKVFDKYNINFTDLKRKAEELYNYCKAKGRRYKDYRAFLRNAIVRDFGYRFRS